MFLESILWDGMGAENRKSFDTFSLRGVCCDLLGVYFNRDVFGWGNGGSG